MFQPKSPFTEVSPYTEPTIRENCSSMSNELMARCQAGSSEWRAQVHAQLVSMIGLKYSFLFDLEGMQDHGGTNSH